MKEMYLQELSKAWRDQKMLDYFKKSTSRVICLTDGGLMPFEKMKIETSFCFGYSLNNYDTEDYDNANRMADHAANSQAYFIAQNLKEIDEKIKLINKDFAPWETKEIYLYRISYYGETEPLNCWKWCALAQWRYIDAIEKNEFTDIRKCSDEDRALILEALQAERAAFEKRLHTYLKRHGMRNVRSWSYWRDA